MILVKDWKPKDAEGAPPSLQHSISCTVVLHARRGSQPHTPRLSFSSSMVFLNTRSLRMFVGAQTSGHDRASVNVPWVDIAIGDGGQRGVKAACAAVSPSLQA